MHFVFPDSEIIQCQPWIKAHPPRKVLFIRLHTFGDVLVTLPIIQDFKTLNPETEMHLLVCEAYADLPRNMVAFDKIHSLKHAKGGWKMAAGALLAIPRLLFERYDAVIDLQNNIHSRTVRRALFPAAWSQFDRFSKIHVIHRYQNTVNALRAGQTAVGARLELRDDQIGIEKLKEVGWNGRDSLIILNPCGLFPTREWTAAKYLEFAQIWLDEIDGSAKFLLIGLERLHEKAGLLEASLGLNCLNLIGKTTPTEAFNIARQASLSLSDDGGLLHISWVNQIPTIGFLGASPSYWGRPYGEKSFGFTSDDLSCGNCHRTDCIWDDNRCLVRITAAMVIERAKTLMLT